MKKIILILSILLVTASAFCQGTRPGTTPGNAYDYIEYAPEYSLKKSRIFTYSFEQNQKFYMISYDTCKNCSFSGVYGDKVVTRNLYLFRLDGVTWVRASNVIQTDTRIKNGSQIITNAYLPVYMGSDRPEIKGSVKILSNGIVQVKLVCFSGVGNNLYATYKIINLIPSDNETYRCEIIGSGEIGKL